MKYYGFYNIETGVTDVRPFDEMNDADDPWYGRGDLWNGSGPWDSYAEAEAAAEAGAATLRRLVIRKAGSSPAEAENYAVIDLWEPIPEGWFPKIEADTSAEADRFIDQQVSWCRWNGIGCDVEPLPPLPAAEESAQEQTDDDLLSENLLAQLARKKGDLY